MAGSNTLRVLVIEDDPDARANLRDILELDDYHVDTAGSVKEAMDRDDWVEYTAIIMDRRLPDGTAEDLLPVLKSLAPRTALIVVTGYDDVQGAISALRLGAVDYILKPVNPDELRKRMGNLAERARTEEALLREHDFAESLIEMAPAIVLVLDSEGRIQRFNRYMRELSGYTLEEVQGKDWFETFLPPEEIPRIREIFEQVRGPCGDRATLRKLRASASSGTHGASPSLPHRFPSAVHSAVRGDTINPIMTKDGRRREIRWSNALLDRGREEEALVLAVGHDITELEEAQERALQAERLAAIGQLITVLAHESGNALANSQACLEMLRWEVEGQPTALDFIARIEKAQRRLRQLYEEVRSYAAPMKLDREAWNLAGIWRQAWESLAGQRQDREATLLEEIGTVNLECKVDAFRLEQLFRNLFENALAACPDPVKVNLRCEEVKLNGRPAVRLVIQDNGPGLGPEQRLRIFEPFFTTKAKGTGLGMAIAKRIMDAHSGQIEVGGKELSTGAEIVVTLPKGC